MNRKTNIHTENNWKDGWTHVHIYKQTYNGWKDRITEGQKTGERLDRQIDKQTVKDLQTDRQIK